ncbi:MAG: DUF2062 domain-containing protein [Armatimonadetes bacterium]|nr:DUF2062 domain-containing protein [Akkermansiaceae bacterium]
MKQRYLKLVKGTYRMLRHRRLRHRPWWKSLTKPLFNKQLWIPCRDTVASGLALGMFFSMMLMPFQMVAAAIMAMRFRVNVPFAVAACWISNVFTNVPIWIAQVWLGDWMRKSLGFPMPGFLTKVHFKVPEAGDLNAASFLLGMMVSGLVLALLSYPLVHLFSAIMPHHLPVIRARNKALHRIQIP